MGVFSRLNDGLKRTREGFFKRVRKLLSFESLDSDSLEEIEELLIWVPKRLRKSSKL